MTSENVPLVTMQNPCWALGWLTVGETTCHVLGTGQHARAEAHMGKTEASGQRLHQLASYVSESVWKQIPASGNSAGHCGPRWYPNCNFIKELE